MGMGEPFLNYDRVLAAADLLRCPFGGIGRRPGRSRSARSAWSRRSTDSPAKSRPFRLAISLGAATDAKRAAARPARRPDARPEVMAAARRHALARRERVMLVYVCIGGVNVDESDARLSPT